MTILESFAAIVWVVVLEIAKCDVVQWLTVLWYEFPRAHTGISVGHRESSVSNQLYIPSCTRHRKMLDYGPDHFV